MMNELNQYRQNGQFFFRPTDRLADVCNAPANSSGVFAIYALERGRTNLVFIGSAGKKDADGNIVHRKDGIKGRIVTGKQFGDFCRKTWPHQMRLENIDTLSIQWFVTYGGMAKDFPEEMEMNLLARYKEANGKLPRWNKEL